MTFKSKITRAFLDLDSFHVVVKENKIMIALDDNLFGLDLAHIPGYEVSKDHCAVVDFNH